VPSQSGLRLWQKCFAFLGALEKLRKATVGFVVSVRLSIRLCFRMEQLGSHWAKFPEILYFIIFRKSVEKGQVSLSSD